MLRWNQPPLQAALLMKTWNFNLTSEDKEPIRSVSRGARFHLESSPPSLLLYAVFAFPVMRENLQIRGLHTATARRQTFS